MDPSRAFHLIKFRLNFQKQEIERKWLTKKVKIELKERSCCSGHDYGVFDSCIVLIRSFKETHTKYFNNCFKDYL